MNEEEFNQNYHDNPILSKIQALKKSDLLTVLNASYISKRFFGKSKSWFSQKMNNNEKNGQSCAFTKDEIKILSNALYTLSIELAEVADELQQD